MVELECRIEHSSECDYVIGKDDRVWMQISSKENNGITLEPDGLFMSNLTMLNTTQYYLVSRFSYIDGRLFFDNTVVSQEYTYDQIEAMVSDLWEELEHEEESPDEPELDIPEEEPDESEPEIGGDTSDSTES